jgi:hypothetical protein
MLYGSLQFSLKASGADPDPQKSVTEMDLDPDGALYRELDGFIN